MRIATLVIVLLLAMALGAFAQGYDPGVIVPTPKKVTASGTCALTSACIITYANASQKGDAVYLSDEIHRLFGLRLKLRAGKPSAAGISLGINPKLSPKEAYVISMFEKSVAISGADADGCFHGIQTLLQILESKHARFDGKLLSFPAAKIEDAPDLPWRGQMHQLCFGVNPNDLPSLLQAMARLKFNEVILEFGPDVQSDSHPEVTAKEAMTRQQCRRIVALARKLHLDPIPGVNSLGHGDRALRLPDMLKAGVGGSLNIANPDTYRILFDVYSEILEDFGHPKYFHAGMDEVWGDFFPQMAQKLGKTPDRVLSDHIEKMNAFFRSKGTKMMIWHDMLVTPGDCPEGAANGGAPRNTALALERVPKDVVLCYWCYDSHVKYPTLDRLKGLGYQVIGTPWYDPDNIAAMSRESCRVSGAVLGSLWTGFSRKWSNDSWCMLGEPRYCRAFVLQAECGWNANADPEKMAYDPLPVVYRLFSGRDSRRSLGNPIPLSLPVRSEGSDPAGRVMVANGLHNGAQVLQGIPFSLDASRTLSLGNSMERRIPEPDWTSVALPLSVVAENGDSCAIDGINTGRGTGQLILYTPKNGPSTGTNPYGWETLISGGRVAMMRGEGAGDSPIPEDGYTLSAHSMEKPTPADRKAIRMVTQRRIGETIRILDANGRELLAPLATSKESVGEMVLPVGKRVSGMAFLHTLDSFAVVGEPIASYEFEYSDGTREVMPVKQGEGILSWRSPRVLQSPSPQAWVATTGPKCESALCAMEWVNPHPEKGVVSVHIQPTPVGAMKGFMVLGVTAFRAPAAK